MAEKLHAEAYQLEQAADLLAYFRDEEEMGPRKERMKRLKAWAKDWLKRDL
jgi:hypothetical protein